MSFKNELPPPGPNELFHCNTDQEQNKKKRIGGDQNLWNADPIYFPQGKPKEKQAEKNSPKLFRPDQRDTTLERCAFGFLIDLPAKNYISKFFLFPPKVPGKYQLNNSRET